MEYSSIAERAAEDPAAFEMLYRLLYSSTYNYVRYRCDSRDLAEELTARVFLKLLENISSYHSDKGAFKPWFYALTRNVVADHYRFEKLRLRNLRKLFDGAVGGANPMESKLVDKEEKAAVLRALGDLSQRERDVLGLRFAFDMSYREIGEVTGLTESNVGVTI